MGRRGRTNGDWPAKDGVLPLSPTYPRGFFKGTVDPTYYGFVAFGHNKALHAHVSQAVGGEDAGVVDDDAEGAIDGSVPNPNLYWIDAGGLPPVTHGSEDSTLTGGCSMGSRHVGAGTPMWGWWPLLLLLLRRRRDSG